MAMRQPGEYLPRRTDFFPKLRRGHGTTHPNAKYDKNGVQTRKPNPCVNDSCSLKRGKGEAHLDQKANANEWKAERGFHKDIPIEECR